MNDRTFCFDIAASPLGPNSTIDRLLTPLQTILEQAGGIRHSVTDSESLPLLQLVLTGGTEQGVLERVAVRRHLAGDEPVVLVAHPLQNSLPACLEILARIRLDGGRGEIVQLDPARPQQAHTQLRRIVRLLSTRSALRHRRIGALGEPSPWLLASDHSAKVVRETWGAELVSVPIGSLTSRLESAPSETARGFAAKITAGCVGQDVGDEAILHAATVQDAIRSIIGEHNLDAVTVRCFDLVSSCTTTGCLALAHLSDEGVPAGCEGDVPSIVAMLWARLLLDQPSWMANPARIDPERGELLLAHCTVPPSMAQGFTLPTHFESGIGVALEGRFEPGPVTLLRLGGRRLEKLWLAEGELIRSEAGASLCRTQARLRVAPQPLTELLTNPLGNHLVLLQGHHRPLLHDSWSLIVP